MTDNPYTISVKKVAEVAAVCPNTVVNYIASNRRLFGVRIRYIKEQGRTSPYRIHRDSLEALQIRFTS